MLATERQQHILRALTEQGSLSVTEIIALLQCSQATARRDLDVLEKEKQLIRVHGGAVLPSVQTESDYIEKSTRFVPIKQLMAKTVCRNYLSNVGTIYLDAGSSTHYIIPFLEKQQHRVVTNGVHHIPQLIDRGIETILLGGLLKSRTQAIIGDSAWRQLENYQVDLALIGANGIDVTFGLSTPDSQEATLKQLAIQQANRTVVLADHSKFNVKTFHRFATLEDVDIVTDEPQPLYEAKANLCYAKEE